MSSININIGNPQGPAGAAGVAVAIAANTIVANNTNATANPTGITASAARELLEVPSDTELAALLSPLASVAYVGANFAAISHNHSADNITSGALAKARQHAQTAYLDASDQTFVGINRFGATDIYRVGQFATATGGVVEFGMLGGSTIGMQSLSSGGDFQTLRLQPNGGALSVGGAATFNGAIGFKEGVWNISNADSARRLFFQNNSTTYIAGNGSNPVQLRNASEQSLVSFNSNFETVFHSTGGGSAGVIIAGAATFNGSVDVASMYSPSFRHKNTANEYPWMLYSPGTDPSWYIRDIVNSRMQITFTPGASASAAVTQIHSQVVVEGAATFSNTAKLGDFTVATLPSAASNAGYEANVTDSSVTTFGSTVAGSGSSRVKVYSNGTNWTVQAA